MIDILDRSRLFDILKQLPPDKKPAFGIMTARHMVEHLAFAVDFSNGNAPQQLYYPIEKTEKIKSVTIYTDKELLPGFKAPMLPAEGLPQLRHPDLAMAIEYLKAALTGFDIYFTQNPPARPTHPVMGELAYAEWIVFHNKHFTHHFKQFALIA